MGERRAGVPMHVVLPRMRYNGSAYLGGGLEPLVVTADPNDPKFQVPNLDLNDIYRDRFAGQGSTP